MTRGAAALWLLAIGCGNGEPATTEAVDDAAVVDVAPVKLDLLLVIDDSSSMCQEQMVLAAAIPSLLERLKDVDYRVAVVTTDVLSEGKMGRFQHASTTEFPFSCHEYRTAACLPDSTGDQTCADAFGEGWTCDGPDKPKQLVNCNGTFNSKCGRTCATDADCDNDPLLLGYTYKCLKPSGDPNNSGCVVLPPSDGPSSDEILATMTADAGCAYLTPSTAPALLHRIVVAGSNQHNNANLESGLIASVLALDREGMNAEQAKCFLRDGAWLAVVYVTNDEDCSTGDYVGPDCDPADQTCGKTAAGLIKLKKEQYGTCACLNDVRNGGPLAAVDDLSARLRALKSDSARIIVAAIVGDSLSADPATKTAEREEFFKSKCSKCDDPTAMHPLLFNTYMCANDDGKAQFGSRYVALVEAFGDKGILTNLCRGVSPSLDTIGTKLSALLKP